MTQLNLERSINFRDLGGLRNKHNRTLKSGKLFRSGDFFELTESDLKQLDHQIDIILDYRDPVEVENRPDQCWKTAHYINAPANPLNSDVTASTSDESLTAQKNLTAYLKAQGAEFFMLTLYERLPFHNPAYKTLVDLLMTQEGKSIVQHCAVGKDRTGMGIALTLLILDFDEQTIIKDYLETEKGLAAFRKNLIERLRLELSTHELNERSVIYSAQLNFILKAFDEIKKKYGTFDEWLLREYHIDEAKKRAIQNYYLV